MEIKFLAPHAIDAMAWNSLVDATHANGAPHMGHAYEALVTDVVARYHRLSGKKTFMLTGADEHGQKIANTAAGQGITPQKLVDTCVARFKALDERLDVAYDDYLRTTSERHKACCRELWRRCAKKGDVFLERYDGWYDERAEQFVKASDAKLQNYKDADGIPLKRTTEECYFFRLGKYAPAVRKHIEANPDFVQPEARRKDVLKMLDDAEEIEKLSLEDDLRLGRGPARGLRRGPRACAVSVLARRWRVDWRRRRRARPGRLRRDDGADRETPPPLVGLRQRHGQQSSHVRWRRWRRQRATNTRVDREPRVDGVGRATKKQQKHKRRSCTSGSTR